MSPQPTRLRFLPAALQAIDDQSSYYASVSESDLYMRWQDAIDEALVLLLSIPEGGALLQFGDSSLAGLRRWPIPGFPNHLLIYRYLPEQSRLLVVDVPHGGRKLQSRLRLIIEQEPSER
jgi:toxin ParE1/3/4